MLHPLHTSAATHQPPPDRTVTSSNLSAPVIDRFRHSRSACTFTRPPRPPETGQRCAAIRWKQLYLTTRLLTQLDWSETGPTFFGRRLVTFRLLSVTRHPMHRHPTTLSARIPARVHCQLNNASWSTLASPVIQLAYSKVLELCGPVGH